MKNLRSGVGLSLAALSLSLLSACGGGGGGSSTPVTQPPVQASCSSGIQIVADTTVEAGKTAGAAALSCGNPLTSILWSQVSGPTVSLPASGTPTVAVETAAAGTIRLRADAVLADGSAASATTDIAVTAAPTGSYLTVRVDHSLRPGTASSVRAWPVLAGADTLSSITWRQTAGPTVTMDTSDQRVMMFTAPASGNDVALKFRATMTTSSGRVDTDDVIISVDRQAAAPSGAIFDRTARVHPYHASSPYASVLARCSYDVSLFYRDSVNQNLCASSTLPLLQADAGVGGVPTVAQVMDRVLVSHDFLGQNFERFLTNEDVNGDFRRLLAGVTTVVIGSHVRPSFYTEATGGIYLDAGQLWLTPEQRDVVTEVPDYRSAFDDPLNFTSLSRMVKNNANVLAYYSPTQRVNRPESELVFVLGRLLYHELGHAGDFIPPAQRNLDGSLSIFRNIAGRLDAGALPSDALANAYPLTSVEMRGLGKVMYQGVTPTALQKSYTPTQVGAFFASDVASDDYAYSIYANENSREDLAMLMEEFMMSYRHGVRYDVAYTNKYVDGLYSTDLYVAWGQRGRIAMPGIKPRIKLVLSRVAPWIDPAAVDSLPATVQMTVGQNWEQSLFQPGSTSLANAGSPRLLSSTVTGNSSSLSIEEKQARVRQDIANRRHAH
ncbi:MAG: hypothetical protein ACJ8GW_15670 [Massilia sp.]